MVVLTAETCWALNEYWIYNKISGIKLVSLYSTINEEVLCYVLLIKYHSNDHIKLDDKIAAYCMYEREKQHMPGLEEWTWLKETMYGRDCSIKMGLISGMGGRPVNLLKPTGYVMHQKFNIQQLYVLLTLHLCVLYLSENKQRLVPVTA